MIAASRAIQQEARDVCGAQFTSAPADHEAAE
jgi:hypothetical protein